MKPYFIIFRILLLFSFVFSQVNINGQVIQQTRAKIENIDFFLQEDQVKILYNLVNGKDWEIFDIKVKVYNAADTSLLPVKTLSGDISAINPGNGKIITWDIKSDLTYLEGNIFIELEAVQTNPKLIPHTSKTKALLLSTVFPGWGSSKTTLKRAHLAKGVLAYSLAGLSVKYNMDARTNYEYYQDAINSEDRDKFYEASESDLATSQYLLVGAISVWVIDYAWILIAPNRTDANRFKNTNIQTTFNQQAGHITPMLSLTHKF